MKKAIWPMNLCALACWTAMAVMLVSGVGCAKREKITEFEQLKDKEFAVPSGTVADQLVLSRFPDAKFKYFNTVLDCCIAVKSGKADAAAYDEPILRGIAAQTPGLRVMSEMITVDQYGFAVRPDESRLKEAMDAVISEARADGTYDEMMRRWLPEEGAPAAMPEFSLDGSNGTLRFGTSAVTEPFSFVDKDRNVVGLDIEFAQRIAQRLGMDLEIVNMEFGGMIPALISGKVDIIGACITITPERAERVLFSEPYYTGGIAALVRE
ncbi:MAG: transporter substrate-binding domain-containing protein [Verrucomicrobiota bacterium]|jgi:polar amino acid transport system substrate-binding protein|nr:amino acid ABC transporter substrate-binding protein [Verrucomicrobiota bacterium]